MQVMSDKPYDQSRRSGLGEVQGEGDSRKKREAQAKDLRKTRKSTGRKKERVGSARGSEL